MQTHLIQARTGQEFSRLRHTFYLTSEQRKEVEEATSFFTNLLTGGPTQHKTEVVTCTATGLGHDVSESGGDYKADLNPYPLFQEGSNSLFCVHVEDSAQLSKQFNVDVVQIDSGIIISSISPLEQGSKKKT